MWLRSRDRLTSLLDRQQQVITFAQVVAAGADRGLPAREVAAGRWQLLCRGIYLASAAAPTDLQRAWCAQLAGGDDAVVTAALVCRILGVADVPDLPMAALVACDCQRAPDGVRLLRTTRPADYPARDDGLRLAEPARAIVDAALMCGCLRDVRGLVMAALNGKHSTAARLRRELDAGPRRGSGRCRRALDDWDDGARSAPEAEAADWLRDEVRARRCPPFLLNPTLELDGVPLGSPDVYVPGTGLGSEMDSVRHHASAHELDATLLRHRRFLAAGVHLEHVTPSRFRADPAAWARQFASAAMSRRGQEPPGLVVLPAGGLQPAAGRRRRSPRS
jgi:hypothetical protein